MKLLLIVEHDDTKRLEKLEQQTTIEKSTPVVE